MDSTIVEVLAEMVKSGGTAAVWAILIWQGANVLTVVVKGGVLVFVLKSILNLVKWGVQLDYTTKENKDKE